jgi:hypothetical protein
LIGLDPKLTSALQQLLSLDKATGLAFSFDSESDTPIDIIEMCGGRRSWSDAFLLLFVLSR